MGNLTIQVARDPERSCGVRLANQNIYYIEFTITRPNRNLL
jgi:hypothetical protein